MPVVLAGDAYTKAVRVNRKTGREYSVFNVEEFDYANFRIADGDSVSVDSILPRYANTVRNQGSRVLSGMYNLGEQINSVRTLVEHAEGTHRGSLYSPCRNPSHEDRSALGGNQRRYCRHHEW